jgi:hypothetical protein
VRREIAREFNAKRRSFFFRALDGNFTAVIAYYGLHNREAKSRAMLLGRVIRSEQALAFFRGQTGAGIGDRKLNVIAEGGGADGQLSTLRHGVDGVEHQILQCALQQVGIGRNFGQRIGQLGAQLDLIFLFLVISQLRMKNAQH